ncbi:Variant surface glycoprotein [Trypanosoma congolense IL3000]|uniref:Variant surface glycoprotein n=1 Tax=Trypanosoma congolense (strain IL3000) TaxID=1068625 RepID=F9WGJ2_TRYCI|nr:Variant surface glycoprotein [Trypanosoma congolense IL3000]
MACFVNVITVIIFMLLGGARGQLEVDKYDNIVPFSLLCRIYNVAKNPPISHVDLEEPFEIVEEINSLNASLVEPKLFNESEHMGNSVGAKLTSTVTKETALSQLSLNQITQKAHTILEEIKKMNVTETIGKAKADFNKVIFGENGNESDLCQATVKDVGDRATACGDTALSSKGSSAGNNLVVDFFCLCVQRQDGKGVNQVCGFYVGSGYENGQLGWNDTGLMGSSTMWASIKGGCGKHMQQHPKSTAEARHILDQFLKHLRTGGVHRWGTSKDKVEGSERKEGMLGTSACTENGVSGNCNIPICNGKEGKKGLSPGGVCVYYGHESEWHKIDWLKQYKTALVSVEAANNQTATIQRAIQKLQMLLHRAEEIYETTKVITEIKNNVGMSAFQNVSGNLTVHNATRARSYSHSFPPYSMPLWFLLLLLL